MVSTLFVSQVCLPQIGINLQSFFEVTNYICRLAACEIVVSKSSLRFAIEAPLFSDTGTKHGPLVYRVCAISLAVVTMKYFWL